MSNAKLLDGRFLGTLSVVVEVSGFFCVSLYIIADLKDVMRVIARDLVSRICSYRLQWIKFHKITRITSSNYILVQKNPAYFKARNKIPKNVLNVYTTTSKPRIIQNSF